MTELAGQLFPRGALFNPDEVDPEPGDDSQRISIPSYWWLTWPEWATDDSWERMAAAAPTVVNVVCNPDSGVGAASHPDWVIQVQQAQAAGLKVHGYVQTDYAGTATSDSHPLATPASIKAEVDKYYSWYNVDGIFFDESSWEAEKVPFYKDIHDYVKAKTGVRGTSVIINPGHPNIDEGYMTTCDIVMCFENYATTYLTQTFPAWMGSYSASRFMHTIHDVTSTAQARQLLELSTVNRAGHIYLTPSTFVPNPWDKLAPEPYWSMQLDYVRGTLPEEETPMIIGANVHAAWNEQSNRAVREAIRDGLQDGNITSVRLDFAWDQIEPTKGNWNWTKLDDLIDVYSDAGMTVVPMLYWPPPWARGSGSGKSAVPRDPAEYGTAIGKIGQRYGRKLAAVEMWNEPDLTGFWSGTRLQYAQLLAGAYPVAKGLAPATIFLAAAPTYLGLASGWFTSMYDTNIYGDQLTHDAQAIHPYMSASDLPPDAPASNYSINGIPWLQDLRAANGDTSPLWATEFGWSTHDNPGTPDPWKRGVTESQHASYTVEAFEIMASYGVVAGYPYTDRDIAGEADPQEHNYGLLYADNSPKPVIAALAAMPVIIPDLEARVAALEAKVAVLEANDAELASNLSETANDLKD